MSIKDKRSAFSLAELMLIVVILGVFAVIAVPRLDYGIVRRYKAAVTAKRIVTDLRLARSLAVSDAATNTQGFQLWMVAPAPYTTYQIKNLDLPATVVGTHTIDSSVSVTSLGSNYCTFGPLGNLEFGSSPGFDVSAEGKTFAITINATTGTVECAEN